MTTISMIKKCYRELRRLKSFEERFEYLKLNGQVGRETFGFDRYMNQQFYSSYEWKQIRYRVIARDLGCDLGIEGFEIHSRILIHHMNPILPEDIVLGNNDILDEEFLISVSHRTHNAIHYGDASLLPRLRAPRRPGDTNLW